MLYDGLGLAVVLLGVVVLLVALRILLRGGWLLGWLKGMFGFMLSAMAIILALSAWDIFSYRQVINEKSIATISFEKIGPQHFDATLVDSSGLQASYEIKGDQWQLDARIIKWSGFISSAGLKPGYRLDRLSGRYYSLEKERNGERTVFNVSVSQSPLDLWDFVRQRNINFGLVDATYGSAAYVPMSDGALFEVTLSHTGLVTRPLNEVAKQAVNRWQ